MLATINWRPTQKDLRSFGRACLIMLAIIAGLLWKFKDLPALYALCICAAGILIFALSLIATQLIKPVYVALQTVTYPIGLTVSFVIMAAFYYCILTPVGLFFRLIGRDPLNRRFDHHAAGYWVPHKTTDSAKRYFSQF
jgi:hypothetical protein